MMIIDNNKNKIKSNVSCEFYEVHVQKQQKQHKQNKVKIQNIQK